MPMNRTRTRLVTFSQQLLALGVGAAWLVASAHAATVTAEPHPTYRRLNFTFPAPAQMKAQNKGDALVLNFNQVVGVTSADIKAQLGAYVSAVTVASDGKTVVLTLTDKASFRQFANGKTVGIDILGADPSAPKSTAASAPAPFQRAKMQEPVSAKAAASTVKAAPIAAVEQATAATPSATGAATNAMTPTTATAAAPEEVIVITSRTAKDGTTIINFPWESRTAAAVFERPHALWIVFSRTVDAHVAQLSTVLPKQVVKVQQFLYPGATVLRLTTDGTLHATALQTGSSYEWDIALSAKPSPVPALDTPLTVDASGSNHYLMLGVFDVAPPLQFFDPEQQDRVIVVPTYEANRGVSALHEYPEFSVLPTQQGIAILSQRNDLTAEALRQGVKIASPTSVAISEHLPIISVDDAPIYGASLATNVMMPYDRWFVPPKAFHSEYQRRLAQIAKADHDHGGEALRQMVALYIGQGFMAEAGAYLRLMQTDYPEFYVANKMALLHAACEAMQGHTTEAAERIAAKELSGMEETQLWQEFIASITPPSIATATITAANAASPPAPNMANTAKALAPATSTASNAIPVAPTTPPPSFDFVHYNKPFLRYYPPRVRQRMVAQLAEAYAPYARENALAVMYGALDLDGVLPPPMRAEMELNILKLALRKNPGGKDKEALAKSLDGLDKLATTTRHPRVQTDARFTAAMLRYTTGMADFTSTVQDIEHLRMNWHGDALERQILIQLIELYRDHHAYGDTLRIMKNLADSFPNDPGIYQLSTDMSELFEQLFLGGLADTLPPLESLATFYEFRELTPVGDRGDRMIQKLADRLAAVDLLDRAIQLLESQIKFRVSGEARARVGARLALLRLINQQPQEALSAIETTNYTGSSPDLQLQRAEIAARALSALGHTEEALSLISTDHSANASLLRLDIFWRTKDWPNVINQAEDVLAARTNLTAPLTPQETDVLLKLVLGYTFEKDQTQLKYLRDYYAGLLTDSGYKQIFDYLTDHTHPLDTEDFALVAKQISHTESFLDQFKNKLAQGKLSEVIP